jgi:hypothetical protein
MREGVLFHSNWKHYIQIILLPKLLSFTKECMIDRLNIIVQEDKTFSHAFKHQRLVFMNVDVLRLLWSSNSSDLNMIESAHSEWKNRLRVQMLRDLEMQSTKHDPNVDIKSYLNDFFETQIFDEVI